MPLLAKVESPETIEEAVDVLAAGGARPN